MKEYILEDLKKNPPAGTTHIQFNIFSYQYINHQKESFRVWLGFKHGGWSIKMDYPHPNFKKFIKLN